MKLLTEEQQELYENAKICYIPKKKLKNIYFKDKQYRKVRDHCPHTGEYTGAAHNICNLKSSVLKKFLQLFIKTIYLFMKKILKNT